MSDSQAGSNQPVGVALVGLGGHGGTIQKATAEAGNLAVRAVCDLDADQRAGAADRFGCDGTESYDAVLERDDVEAVILVTPNHLHRGQAVAALEAGLDVFVEKPIANVVEDGLAMMEAAERSSRILMVGHNMRRSRAARKARALLEEGRLGEVVSVDIHFSSDTGLRLQNDSWRLRPGYCPLMPVMQLGIHAIDLVHYFLAPIASVSARARSVASPPNIQDSVVATFETESGELGTMVSNYCTQIAFEYRLSGTEGSLWGTPHRLAWRRREDTDGHGEGPAEEHDFRAHGLESYVLQMKEFGHAVRSRERPETDARVGLRALSVVEAMRASVESGRRESTPALEVI